MGKQGPCYHCGVTSTPLWRNGPPDKPVLCNACGSRWRTKGTLANYAPLHARAEADEYEDHRDSKVKTISLRKGDEKLNKRKLCYEDTVVKRYAADYNQSFLKITDEDTSNKSSSGSAVSNSESCARFSSADASDLTGPAQSAVWETLVPSKKRTCVTRTKSSPVEKFIKDLHAILREQQSSYLSSSEEDLLIESDEPMVSVEIGHGSVLIKHPSSLVREEESEGDNACYHGSESVKKLTGEMMHQEPSKRNKPNHDRMQLFWTRDSPLLCIDLSDVINFEVLLGHLTSEEQQQLLIYLPPSDTSQLPGSLKNMFDSSGFKENLSCFQQLLSEGVFCNNYTGVKAEDLKALKKLAVSNLTKSKWLGLYCKLKHSRFSRLAGDILVASGSKSSLSSAKRPLQEQNQNMPGKETRRKDPKRGPSKSGLGSKEPLDSDGSFFAGRTMFGLPTDGHRIMLESSQFPDESSDQDLLLDVPLNGSFPQAELLLPTSSFATRKTNASSSSIQVEACHTAV